MNPAPLPRLRHIPLSGITRRQLLGGFGALGVMAVAGCTDADPGSDGDGDGDGDSKQTTLVVAIGEVDGYDWRPEADNEKSCLTFGDCLTTLDPDTLEAAPGLAESWELSDDGNTWTFHLRPDVPFHDDWGTVTSEDVKFTYGKWTQEDADHGPRTLQMRAAIDNDLEKNFEIVDDLTFMLHTTTPVVQLSAVLSYQGAGMTITSKKYFDETEPDVANSHPIGTGPWKFVSSKPKQELVLEAVKTPHPYRGTPQFDRAVLSYIPDGATRLAQLQSGAASIAQLQSSLSGEADAAGLQLVSIKSVAHADLVLGGCYFGDSHLDQDSPWIQGSTPDGPGKAIREALSLAIDRQLIIDKVLAGDGALTKGPLMVYNESDALTDPSWTVPEYDPEKAKAKLAEGGYPDGFPIEFILFDQDVDTVGVGEAIAGMWEEIGIEVKRSPVEEEVNDEYLKNYESQGHAWIHLQGADIEPAPQLQPYYPDPTYGDYKWFHPAATAAFDQITSETDKDTRFAVATEALGQMREDFVPINLFSCDLPYAVSADIKSWVPLPVLNTLSRLEDVVPA